LGMRVSRLRLGGSGLGMRVSRSGLGMRVSRLGYGRGKVVLFYLALSFVSFGV